MSFVNVLVKQLKQFYQNKLVAASFKYWNIPIWLWGRGKWGRARNVEQKTLVLRLKRNFILAVAL